jgi:hypothetical protein
LNHIKLPDYSWARHAEITLRNTNMVSHGNRNYEDSQPEHNSIGEIDVHGQVVRTFDWRRKDPAQVATLPGIEWRRSPVRRRSSQHPHRPSDGVKLAAKTSVDTHRCIGQPYKSFACVKKDGYCCSKSILYIKPN